MAKRKKNYISPKVDRMTADRFVQNSSIEGQKQFKAARKWYSKGGKVHQPKYKGQSSEKRVIDKFNGNSGSRRSYRPTPKFSTSVMSAVSLLLVIGLIATVFFAYENSTRAEGEAFQYFSPAKFLENISSDKIVIPASEYVVEYYIDHYFDGLFSHYYQGRLTIGGYSYDSESLISNHSINDESKNYTFFINGEYYTSWVQHHFDENGNPAPVYDENGFIVRKVSLPQLEYEIDGYPDFGKVSSAWASVGDEETVWGALRVTGQYFSDYLSFQSNVLKNMLPWNSVVMSDDITTDEIKIYIPWRDENHEYIDLP